MSNSPRLQRIIYRHYLRSALVPMLLVECLLLALYFGINLYISGKNQALLLDEVRRNLLEVTATETAGIDMRLAEIARLSRLLQADHQRFFVNPEICVLPNGEPRLEPHPNGAFYKTADNGGASLYYSASTVIGADERRQARCSEAIDPLLRAIVETHPLVTQSYLNTADGMNRLYPFMHDAAERFGASWNVEDLVFYVEADAAHNPKREPVWTGAYLDPAGQGWVMSSLVPIYRDERLVAVSGIDITLDSVVSHVLDLHFAWEAMAFLVDNRGTILAMPPRVERIMGLKELHQHDYRGPMVETHEKPDEYNLLTGRHPVFRDRLSRFFHSRDSSTDIQVDDAEYLLIQRIVAQNGWRLMVLAEKTKIFAPIEDLRALSTAIGYLAIGGILFFYLMFFLMLRARARRLATQIARPIHALSEATSHLGQGLRNQSLRAVGIQEIDALNRHFNAMIEELDERTTQLAATKIRERLRQEETQTLERLASTDTLTQVHNRRKIDDLLGAEYARFERGGPPFGVILCDIDHFKQVNDQHGHLIGDQVLAEMARLLASSLRESDWLGRWGGEEFIILCPNASRVGLATLADILRQRIAAHRFEVVGTKTVSLGTTLARPGENLQTLFARADRALYAAKNGGRNRVEVAD